MNPLSSESITYRRVLQHHTNLPLKFLDLFLRFLSQTRTFLIHLARTNLCNTIGYVSCRFPCRFFRCFPHCFPHCFPRRFPLRISNSPTRILTQNFRVLLLPLCSCYLTIALNLILPSVVPSIPHLTDSKCAYSLYFSVLS